MDSLDINVVVLVVRRRLRQAAVRSTWNQDSSRPASADALM